MSLNTSMNLQQRALPFGSSIGSSPDSQISVQHLSTSLLPPSTFDISRPRSSPAMTSSPPPPSHTTHTTYAPLPRMTTALIIGSLSPMSNDHRHQHEMGKSSRRPSVRSRPSITMSTNENAPETEEINDESNHEEEEDVETSKNANSTNKQTKTYFYNEGESSDNYSNFDELNEQILEEDRRRLRQLGLDK